MKAKYKVGLALFAAGGLWLASAHAGLKGTYPLTVDTAARTLSGSLGSTRNSADVKSYLGVEISQVKGVGSFFPENVSLFYRTNGGQNTYLMIDDANLVEIAHTITGDSYIEASWDANFVVQSLLVQQASYATPKAL